VSWNKDDRSLSALEDSPQLGNLVFVDHHFLVGANEQLLEHHHQNLKSFHGKVTEDSFEHFGGNLLHLNLRFGFLFWTERFLLLQFLLDNLFHFSFDPFGVEDSVLGFFKGPDFLMEHISSLPGSKQLCSLRVVHPCSGVTVPHGRQVGFFIQDVLFNAISVIADERLPLDLGRVKVESKIWFTVLHHRLEFRCRRVVKDPLIVHKVSKLEPNLFALGNILNQFFGVCFLFLVPENFGDVIQTLRR